MSKHECSRDGDTVPKIAKKKGFRDWKTVWEENKSLKSSKKRANPLMLFTGDSKSTPDKIELPKKKKGKKGQASTDHKAYVVPSVKLSLRTRILKGDFTPLIGRDFELTVEGAPEPFKGKTDGAGRTVIDGADPEVPIDATKATLVVRIKPEDVGAEEQAGGGGGDAEGGEDAGGEEAVAGDPPVSWELKIGGLNPIEEKAPNTSCLSGVQQRLNNLGLKAGPVDGVNGANTKAAVEGFQSLFNLTVDGKAGKKTQAKLREIHDTDKHNGTAPGTLEIKSPVSNKKRLETTADDVGFVTADFSDASPVTLNTLVIRPTYRISLELGSIDGICPEDANTPEGRRRRLQLLGYLYDNLTDDTVTDTGNAVWSWYTTDLGQSDATLADQIQDEILEGGALPAEDEVKKIRVPGGYCYRTSDANDALSGVSNGGEHVKFQREQALWDANPTLGAIPIMAKVEAKTGDDEWSPASGVMVYLQLQPPDDLEDGDKPTALRDGTSHFTGRRPSSPKEFVDDKIKNFDGRRAHRIDPKDPQVDNAHHEVGGKRGLPVAGSVFELNAPDGSPRKGLYAEHVGRNLPLKPVLHEVPEEAPVKGKKHKNAVRARTAEDGKAAFVFTPARTGGDRYKLRAYLGPGNPGFEGNGGTGVGAVSVDTGTMVVWRRVRFSHNFFWGYPSGDPGGNAAGGAPTIDLANVGTQFEKAYQDVNVEATGARTEMTAAQWTAGRNFAVGKLTAAFPTLDFDTLTPAANTDCCIVNIVEKSDYDRDRVATKPVLPAADDAYYALMGRVVDQFLDGFVEHFTKNALPFVLIYSPSGDTVTQYEGADFTTSGVASSVRGAYVFYGRDIYNNWVYPRPNPITPDQGADANSVHEIGHCHYGAHHWTARGDAGELLGGAPDDHDQKDFCIMGYLDMEGDFCGRCILKHRGWNVAKLGP